MPWYQVVIKHSDDEMIEQLSIQRLIVPFIGVIRKRRAVGAFQDDIEVWLCLDDGCDRIYYFSPNRKIFNSLFSVPHNNNLQQKLEIFVRR